MSNTILKLDHIIKEFPSKSAFFKKNNTYVHAVNDVSLSIKEGETLCLVGESGCGKSTLGRLMIGLLTPTSGTISYNGQPLPISNEKEMHALRKNLQIVFQDPYASLNPRMKIKDIIAEPMLTHKMYSSEKEVYEKVDDLLTLVGIRKEFGNRFPHQFSGGQRQRVGIARALSLNPKLIVCDEPVSALDVSIQAQILNLLSDIKESRKLTYIFISHDLSVVRYMADRVCVMFLGQICELGNAEEIFQNPLHPYTKFLGEAVPKIADGKRIEDKEILAGEVPSPVHPPKGCCFSTRCPYVTDKCREKRPELMDMDGHMIACHYPGDLF